MSLKESFHESKIEKILVIDDDFSQQISLEDLRKYDSEDVINKFDDEDDPDYISMLELLEECGLNCASPNDLANSLSNSDVRSKAPENFSALAEAVLASRSSSAQRVETVIGWLQNEGISDDQITIVSSTEEIEDADSYDLILIDYLLVESLPQASVTFIKHRIERADNTTFSQLFILMSSYGTQLREQFESLKQEVQASSSRLRILEKPSGDPSEKLRWLCTFQQLSKERSLINPIESFITSWRDKIQTSATILSNELWGLDAHCFDVLRRTSKLDGMSFEEYMAQIFSRGLLAHIEKSEYPKDQTSALVECLDNNTTIRQGSEIEDSSIVLKRFMNFVNWHREEWYTADKPLDHKNSTEDERFEWFVNNVQYGTVFRSLSKPERYLVNVTQPCDMARLQAEEIDDKQMLLFPGVLSPTPLASDQQSAHVETDHYDEGGVRCGNMHWSIKKPKTPSIRCFICKYLTDYEISGQIRQDRGHHIVNTYAALTSRVASIKMPTVTSMNGCLVVREGRKNASWLLHDQLITGVKYLKNQSRKSDSIELEPDQVVKIIQSLKKDENNINLMSELLCFQAAGELTSDKDIQVFESKSRPDFDKVPAENHSLEKAVNKVINNNKVLLLIWPE